MSQKTKLPYFVRLQPKSFQTLNSKTSKLTQLVTLLIDIMAKSLLNLVLGSSSLFGVVTYYSSVEVTISIDDLTFEDLSHYLMLSFCLRVSFLTF